LANALILESGRKDRPPVPPAPSRRHPAFLRENSRHSCLSPFRFPPFRIKTNQAKSDQIAPFSRVMLDFSFFCKKPLPPPYVVVTLYETHNRKGLWLRRESLAVALYTEANDFNTKTT
jgi:hypothetical protein